MNRSKMDPWFWWHEDRRVYFTIDLRSWGLGVSLRKYWNVKVLCFELGRT